MLGRIALKDLIGEIAFLFVLVPMGDTLNDSNFNIN